MLVTWGGGGGGVGRWVGWAETCLLGEVSAEPPEWWACPTSVPFWVPFNQFEKGHSVGPVFRAEDESERAGQVQLEVGTASSLSLPAWAGLPAWLRAAEEVPPQARHFRSRENKLLCPALSTRLSARISGGRGRGHDDSGSAGTSSVDTVCRTRQGLAGIGAQFSHGHPRVTTGVTGSRGQPGWLTRLVYGRLS